MPALDFPSSPTNGQVFGQYVYDSTKGAWRVSADLLASATPSPTAPVNPVSGDLWFNTNDGVMFMYLNDGNSSQWVEVKSNTASGSTVAARVDALEAKPSGLVAITPTSIAVGSGTATVSGSSLVTFTGATNIKLNGVFTSQYKSYRIVLDVTSASSVQSVILRYLVAGVEDTGTNNYFAWARSRENSTAASAGAVAASYGFIVDTLTDIGCSATLEIIKPKENAATRYLSNSFGYDNASYAGYSNGVKAGTTSYDGITFIMASGGTFSGSVQVYGYR